MLRSAQLLPSEGPGSLVVKHVHRKVSGARLVSCLDSLHPTEEHLRFVHFVHFLIAKLGHQQVDTLCKRLSLIPIPVLYKIEGPYEI